MYTMYGIANCDTVKKARKFIENQKIDYTFVDFKKEPPTPELLNTWKESMGEWPINKKGLTYKKFKEQYESLSETSKLSFIIEHSSMIKRPILMKKNKILSLGFDLEEYSKL